MGENLIKDLRKDKEKHNGSINRRRRRRNNIRAVW